MDHVLSILPWLAAAVLGYCALFSKTIIREFECGLLYHSGRFQKQLGPGAHRNLRFWRSITVLDLRKRTVTVPGQEVLTADQVGLKVSLVATYQVCDPQKAEHEVEDFTVALYLAAQIALRKVVGSVEFDKLLQDRVNIGSQVTSDVVINAEPLGLKVHSVEIKDVMLPAEVRKAFSEVVRARQEGQAALERARSETASLRTLANAARLMEEHPCLLDLRILQTLSTIGAGQTIVLNTTGGLASLKVPSASPPDKPDSA